MSRNQLSESEQARLTEDELIEVDVIYDRLQELRREERELVLRRAHLYRKAMGLRYRFQLKGEPT